jgi:hypothetical protein
VSRWETRIREHPIHAVMALIRDRAVELDDWGDVEDRESIVRLGIVLDLITSALAERNGHLFTARVLDRWQAATTAVERALSGLSAVAADGDDTAARAAREAVDQCVDELLDLVVPWHATSIDAVARLRAKGEELEAELSTYYVEQRASVTRLGERMHRDAATQNRSLAGLRQEWQAQAAEVLTALQQYRQQAAEIVGTIATTSLAGGYKEYADNEQRSADRWRWVSVGGAVTAAVLAVVLLVLRQDRPFSWDLVIGKTLVVLLVGAVSAYANRESHAHRDREVVARRLQLELTALDPYLASLTTERRAVIKEQVAQRIFGRSGATDPGAGVLAAGTPAEAAATNPAAGANGRQRVEELLGQVLDLVRRNPH